MTEKQRAKIEDRIYAHDQRTSECSCSCDRCWNDWAALEEDKRKASEKIDD
jgi:hypothetical protein